MARTKNLYSLLSSSDEDGGSDTNTRSHPRIKATRQSLKKKTRPSYKTHDTSLHTNNSDFERTGIFRFQDLPGEIRNHIYGFALVVDKPIAISRPVDQPATLKKEQEHQALWDVRPPSGQRQVYKFCAVVQRGLEKSEAKLKFSDAAALSLLVTNKAISSEARPLLYARNTFKFETSKAFYAFYECAHEAFPLLENLEFVDLPDSTVLSAPLARSPRLSRVSITIKSDAIRKHPVERIGFLEIENLVLRCRCTTCRNSRNFFKAQPGVKPGEGCIAATYEMQRQRLKTVSLCVNDFEIRLTKDGNEPSNETNDIKKRLKDKLLGSVDSAIRTNVTRAHGAPRWQSWHF